MEKAIHISSLKNLMFFENGRYQRIYWGTEFCQNLIPGTGDTERIISFIRENNLEFSLVTPFVTEKGLTRLIKLFQFLKTRLKDCEIVVNDWGVLRILSKRFKRFRPSLGRLLSRQNRDPSIARILEKQLPCGTRSENGAIKVVVHVPPGRHYKEGIRASYLNVLSTQKFLSRFNIGRVEINNVMQGVNLKNMALKASLYTPFVNVSTTRFCPMESRFEKMHRIDVCERECQRHYSRLVNKRTPKILYRRGNTVFYKNPVILKHVDKTTVDRIVFQPELPF